MKNLLIFIFLLPCLAFAQVEHNFEMAPANTDCHTLPDTFANMDEAITAIESSKFRLQESIKISRIRSPRAAKFYSCDGEKGYMVVTQDENNSLVYPDIPVKIWNDFINAGNPIDYYDQQVKGKYGVVGD